MFGLKSKINKKEDEKATIGKWIAIYMYFTVFLFIFFLLGFILNIGYDFNYQINNKVHLVTFRKVCLSYTFLFGFFFMFFYFIKMNGFQLATNLVALQFILITIGFILLIFKLFGLINGVSIYYFLSTFIGILLFIGSVISSLIYWFINSVDLKKY